MFTIITKMALSDDSRMSFVILFVHSYLTTF